jgi:predicted nucleic acid-binding protein
MAKKPVRVFLDSNVILSGLLSYTGSPRLILDLLTMELPDLVGVTGRYNIIELERNIRKKAPKVLPVYDEYFPKMRLELVPMPSPAEVTKHSGVVADKDTPVLVSAIKGKVDFLVTGDKKHFEKIKKSVALPFKIMNPAEFLEAFAEILKAEEA